MSNGAISRTMSEDACEQRLNGALRAFGLTDDEPAIREECPGCGGEVEIYDEDALPMGYECFRCAALYEVIRGNDGKVKVEFVKEM